jgi:hypothetical protein
MGTTKLSQLSWTSSRAGNLTRSSELVEIMRGGCLEAIDSRQRADLGDEHGGLIAFRPLEAALREKKRLGGDDHAEKMEVLFFDKEVDDACFVLQRDEAVAVCVWFPTADGK